MDLCILHNRVDLDGGLVAETLDGVAVTHHHGLGAALDLLRSVERHLVHLVDLVLGLASARGLLKDELNGGLVGELLVLRIVVHLLEQFAAGALRGDARGERHVASTLESDAGSHDLERFALVRATLRALHHYLWIVFYRNIILIEETTVYDNEDSMRS